MKTTVYTVPVGGSSIPLPEGVWYCVRSTQALTSMRWCNSDGNILAQWNNTWGLIHNSPLPVGPSEYLVLSATVATTITIGYE